MFNLLGGVGLPIAIVIFLVSAVVVVLLGVQLARYGDALATLTGLGASVCGQHTGGAGDVAAGAVQ